MWQKLYQTIVSANDTLQIHLEYLCTRNSTLKSSKKKKVRKWTSTVPTEQKAYELEPDTLLFKTWGNFSESKEFVTREWSKNSFANLISHHFTDYIHRQSQILILNYKFQPLLPPQ